MRSRVLPHAPAPWCLPCRRPKLPLRPVSPPTPAQAQTAELRSSIDSIKGLVAALEEGHVQRASAAAPGEAADGLTVAELRSELRNFAQTLQE